MEYLIGIKWYYNPLLIFDIDSMPFDLCGQNLPVIAAFLLPEHLTFAA